MESARAGRPTFCWSGSFPDAIEALHLICRHRRHGLTGAGMHCSKRPTLKYSWNHKRGLYGVPENQPVEGVRL